MQVSGAGGVGRPQLSVAVTVSWYHGQGQTSFSASDTRKGMLATVCTWSAAAGRKELPKFKEIFFPLSAMQPKARPVLSYEELKQCPSLVFITVSFSRTKPLGMEERRGESVSSTKWC